MGAEAFLEAGPKEVQLRTVRPNVMQQGEGGNSSGSKDSWTRVLEREAEVVGEGLSQGGDGLKTGKEKEGESVDLGSDEGEELEEAEAPVIRKAPKGPTQKEREEHEATHLPYRSWCKHCVRERGRNKPHRRQDEEDKDEEKEKAVPRISMDYFFMSEEEQQASENPLIIMVDESTGNKYMRAVGKKGLGEGNEMEWLIKDMDDELKGWGHPGGAGDRLIMKSDGEAAMVAVREALAKYHGSISPEQPPKGESQANGVVEEAGKTVRGLVKVMKDQMEDKAQVKIGESDEIMHWLVRWAAMVHSRFQKGTDGKTAYERQKGRKCKTEAVPFGEKVMYKKLKESGEKKKVLEDKWDEGVWLGHSRHSPEIMIGTRDGVVRAWAVKRLPAESRWDGVLMKSMKGTPSQPNPTCQAFMYPSAFE